MYAKEDSTIVGLQRPYSTRLRTLYLMSTYIVAHATTFARLGKSARPEKPIKEERDYNAPRLRGLVRLKRPIIVDVKVRYIRLLAEFALIF